LGLRGVNIGGISKGRLGNRQIVLVLIVIFGVSSCEMVLVLDPSLIFASIAFLAK
jgi:hypothetical protein